VETQIENALELYNRATIVYRELLQVQKQDVIQKIDSENRQSMLKKTNSNYIVKEAMTYLEGRARR
jgi:hypothetical protein